MAEVLWAYAVGWLIFVASIIFAIILFSRYKRMYPVIYMVSIALYIFTISYWIDAFDLQAGPVTLILAFSAILFMGLGFYFSKVLGE